MGFWSNDKKFINNFFNVSFENDEIRSFMDGKKN